MKYPLQLALVIPRPNSEDELQVLALLVGPPRVLWLVLIPRGDGVRYVAVHVLLVAEVACIVSKGGVACWQK